MCIIDQSRQNSLRKISDLMVLIVLLSAQGRCIYIGEPILDFMPSNESLVNRTLSTENSSKKVSTKHVSFHIKKSTLDNIGNNVLVKFSDFISKNDTESKDNQKKRTYNITHDTSNLENELLSFREIQPMKTASDSKSSKLKIDLQANSNENKIHSIQNEKKISRYSTIARNLEANTIQGVIDVKNNVAGDEKLEEINKKSLKTLLNESLNITGSKSNPSMDDKHMQLSDSKSSSDQNLNTLTDKEKSSVKRFLEALVTVKSNGSNLNSSSERTNQKSYESKSSEEKLKKRVAISANRSNIHHEHSQDYGLQDPSLEFQNYFMQQFKSPESSKQQEPSIESSKLSGFERQQDPTLKFQDYYVQQKPSLESQKNHKQTIKSEESLNQQEPSHVFENFLKQRFQSQESMKQPSPSLDFQHYYNQQLGLEESRKQQEMSLESSGDYKKDTFSESQDLSKLKDAAHKSSDNYYQHIKSNEYLESKQPNPSSDYLYIDSSLKSKEEATNQGFTSKTINLDTFKKKVTESSGDVEHQDTFTNSQNYSKLKDAAPQYLHNDYQKHKSNKSQDSKQLNLSNSFLENMQQANSSQKSKEVVNQAFTSKFTNPDIVKKDQPSLESQNYKVQSVASLLTEEKTGKQNVCLEPNNYVKIINETIKHQELIKDININNEFAYLIYNFFKNRPSAQISDETFDDIIDKIIALKNANKVRSSGRRIRIPEKIALNHMLLELRQLISNEDESLVKYNWLSSGINVQDGLHSIIKLCDATEITVIDEKLLLFVERLLQEARDRLPRLLRVKKLDDACAYFKEVHKRVGPLHVAMDEIAAQEDLDPTEMFYFLKLNYLVSPSRGQLMTILLHSAINRVIEQIDIKFREARVNNKLKDVIDGDIEKTQMNMNDEKLASNESHITIRKAYADLLEDIVLIYTILAEFNKHQPT